MNYPSNRRPISQRAVEMMPTSVRRVVVMVLACLGGAALQAQSPVSGSIQGRVFNPATQEYVRNAEIHVDGGNLVASDNFGDVTGGNIGEFI